MSCMGNNILNHLATSCIILVLPFGSRVLSVLDITQSTVLGPRQPMVCNGGRTHLEEVVGTVMLTINLEVSRKEAWG